MYINSIAEGLGQLNSTAQTYTQVIADKGIKTENTSVIISYTEDMNVSIKVNEDSSTMIYDVLTNHYIMNAVEYYNNNLTQINRNNTVLTFYQAVVFAEDDPCVLEGDPTDSIRLVENLLESSQNYHHSELTFRLKSLKSFVSRTNNVYCFDNIKLIDSLNTGESLCQITPCIFLEYGGVQFAGTNGKVAIVGFHDYMTFAPDTVYNYLRIWGPTVIQGSPFNNVTVEDTLAFWSLGNTAVFEPGQFKGYKVTGNLDISMGSVLGYPIKIDFDGIEVEGDLSLDIFDLRASFADCVVNGDLKVTISRLDNPQDYAMFNNAQIDGNLIVDLAYGGGDLKVGLFEGATVSNLTSRKDFGAMYVKIPLGIGNLYKNLTVKGIADIQDMTRIAPSMLEGVKATEVIIGEVTDVADKGLYSLDCDRLICFNGEPFLSVGEDAFTTSTPGYAVGYKTNTEFYEKTLATGYIWDSMYSIFKGHKRYKTVYRGYLRIEDIFVGDNQL